MRKSNIRLKKKGSNIEVLYEDNHIIAINKKSGDLVQGDKSRDTPPVSYTHLRAHETLR